MFFWEIWRGWLGDMFTVVGLGLAGAFEGGCHCFGYGCSGEWMRGYLVVSLFGMVFYNCLLYCSAKVC